MVDVIHSSDDFEKIHQDLLSLERDGFSHQFWNFVTSAQYCPHGIETDCWRSLKSARRNEEDSIQFITRVSQFSGNFPPSFRNETYADLGDYDSCLLHGRSHGLGQYCLISMIPDFDKLNQIGAPKSALDQLYPIDIFPKARLEVGIGLCVPSSCSNTDIFHLSSKILNSVHWHQTRQVHCEVPQSFEQKVKSGNFVQKLCLIVLTVLISMVIWAGCIDILSNSLGKPKLIDKQSTFHHYFSPKLSIESLFNHSGSKHLLCLDISRLITLFLVFSVHIIFFPPMIRASSLLADYRKTKTTTEKFASQIYATSFYFEYIMIIGGACSTIMIWKKTNVDVSFRKFISIIVDRFVQFQIVFITTFSMQIILPFFGDGPLYHVIETEIVKNCQSSFWYNIFHVANLLDLDEAGLTYLWTASTEFQLFVVVSFMIFIERRLKCAGISIGLIGTFCSLIFTVHTIYKHNIQPGVIFFPYKAERIHQFFGQLYSGTLSHAWSYLGISVILIWVLGNKSLPVSKWLRTHFTHAICALLASFSLAYFNCLQNEPKSLSSSIYFISIAILLSIGNFSSIMTESNAIRECCSKVSSSTLRKDLEMEINGNSSSRDWNSKDSPSSDESASKSSNNFDYWIHVALKLSRAAYFSHWTFLTWYFLRKREPVSMIGFERVKDVLTLVKIYIIGFIFFIFVISPCERITEDIKRIFLPEKIEKAEENTSEQFKKD